MNGKRRKRRDARIREVFAECGTIRETARRLGHSVNTVRKVLRGESRDRRPPARREPRPSKLDPYRATIRRLVLDDQLSAVLVLEEIRELGYPGGYSILKDYVRQLRPTPPNKPPTTVLERPPGKDGQVDWSPYRVRIGGVEFVVHAFSLVLPFSRYMVVRFALDETLETLVALHEEAFAGIGAVPGLMTYDNMTTVGRHIGPGEVWLNPRFVAYAEPYGFDIHLIDPGKPNQHASVERPFHYVEHNCLKRRRSRFEDLLDLNRHAKWWCDEVANVRIHGTTRQRLVDLLERNEISPTATPWSTEAAARTAAAAGTTAAMVAAVATDRPPTLLEELRRNLKALKLGAMLAELDDALEEAQTTQQGYATFLAGLVRKQLAARMAAAYARRIDKAEFPCKRGFDDFDWTFQPGLNVQLVKDLMTLDFVRQARPVLLLGKPGTGKTHLSIALGRRAAEAGHRVRFYKATRLLQELYATLADGSTQRLVRYLARLDVLVIDDLRALPPQPEYASLLYELVEARHGHKTTIVSSNLSLSAWGQVLGDKTLTASMVDRLMERAHVLNIKKGRSYRTEGPEAPPADDQPKDLDARDETES